MPNFYTNLNINDRINVKASIKLNGSLYAGDSYLVIKTFF